MISLPGFLDSFFRYMELFGSYPVGILTHLLFWGVVIATIILVMKEIWN